LVTATVVIVPGVFRWNRTRSPVVVSPTISIAPALEAERRTRDAAERRRFFMADRSAEPPPARSA
jgi:hypothetical protein